MLVYFCPDNRDAGLYIGLRNLCDHARLEAAFQTIFESREKHGVLITRKDDLFVVIMERIKDVEQFLLCFFGIGDKLDVVHDEDVVLAVLIFEIVRPAASYRIDVVGGEALRRYVQNLHIAAGFFEVITDRLNEMGFAASRRTVYEKRIISEARPLDERFCRGVGELVKGPHDEGIESIARVEVVALVYIQGTKIKRRVLSLFAARRFALGRRDWRTVHCVFHGPYGIVERTESLKDKLVMLLHQPLLHDFRRHGHLHSSPIASDDVRIAKPCAKRCLRCSEFYLDECILPQFAISHRRLGYYTRRDSLGKLAHISSSMCRMCGQSGDKKKHGVVGIFLHFAFCSSYSILHIL